MYTKLKAYNENILVPRNIESRQEKLRQQTIKMLGEEVINGDFIFEEWMLDIPDNQIKVFTVNGDFEFAENVKIKQLPDWIGRIQYVYGQYSCDNLGLTTLKNSPKHIKWTFDCSFNDLTTLENGPIYIGTSYFCNNNKLTSLKGCPEKIDGIFSCTYNKLKSLIHGPKIVQNSYHCNNNFLETLNGAPKNINGIFNCINNHLHSLEGGPEYVRDKYECYNNPIVLELPDNVTCNIFDN